MPNIPTSPPWSESGKERYIYQSEFMDPMTHAAFSELPIGNSPVIIVGCIPAKWAGETISLGDKEISVPDAIKTHFGRDFVVDRQGQRGQKTISVTDVKVLTETHALLYSFLLNKKGEIDLPDFQYMNFAVVDIGELTTCIDVFRGKERQGSGVTLHDVSMGNIHKATAARVLELTGRDLKHWEVRDIVRGNGIIKLSASRTRHARDFDIMPIYYDIVDQTKPVLRSHFADYVGRLDDIHYIIVGGGGSKVMGDVWQYNDQARICGQYATLQGLQNYGELVCKTDG